MSAAARSPESRVESRGGALVSIHCYPNGNGRHARLAADLLLAALERDRFSWGSANLVDASATRAAYVAALRAADSHDYGPLITLARS